MVSGGDLIEIFKTIKGFSGVSWSKFFFRADSSTTRDHNWKQKKTNIRHDSRLHFFSQRSVNRWNILSQAVDAPSINSFKNLQEKQRLRKMDFFMESSPLVLWL